MTWHICESEVLLGRCESKVLLGRSKSAEILSKSDSAVLIGRGQSEAGWWHLPPPVLLPVQGTGGQAAVGAEGGSGLQAPETYTGHSQSQH